LEEEKLRSRISPEKTKWNSFNRDFRRFLKISRLLSQLFRGPRKYHAHLFHWAFF